MNNNIFVSRAIIKEIGMEEAMFLSMIEMETSLDSGEWIEFSTEDCTKHTMGQWGEKPTARIMKSLKDSGLIDVKYEGMPRRRYIKLNIDLICGIALHHQKLIDERVSKYGELSYIKHHRELMEVANDNV
ncbi:MAG: hypothetical protein ACRCX2_08785 [Paraclostridium sp.]